MNEYEAIIDGRTVEIGDGESILIAAQRLGIDIPTLCHHSDLSPEGGCRICVVYNETDGRCLGACHTPLTPGMRIVTQTPRINELRRSVMSLILSEHAPNTFSADGDGHELSALAARLKADPRRYGTHLRASTVDTSHPYLRFDPSRCVTCARCLHACEQVQGQFVYGMEGRGDRTRLIFGPSESFADSDCTACGSCVDHCPTGAISDIDRIGGRAATNATESICGYCGVGCRVRIETADDRVVRIGGVADAAVNRGQLCVKGRYAHAWHHHPDRLTQPLRRENGELKPIAWDEAIRWLAQRLKQIHHQHGANTQAAISSSRSTNEAAYLLQKLYRTTLGTNNVDCCARVCHSSTALALATVTGTGAASASYADIERARCIVVAGANPTEAHPVVGARIKQAVLRGARLIVIDPRRIELAEYAELHLQLRPGSNVALFNAIAKLLIEQQRYDAEYVAQRTEGFDELVAFAAKMSLAEASRDCGVDETLIRRAAAILGQVGPTLFVHGLGLSELTQGTASVMTLCNLGMLTGSIGKAGAGMLPLRGQNNVQGNADMGGMPDRVTGYQKLDDPQVRGRFEKIWGVAPPIHPGLTVSEMIAAAGRGELRSLWVQGEDLAQSDPDQTHVIEALKKLELLVVQDPFMCETGKYAHLILPAASWMEQEGTFTNGERRIQHVRPAVTGPADVRADWRITLDVANALGAPWKYDSPAQIMDEIAQVAPRLFGGVGYARLAGDGLQWPCPSADHPGTATVHAAGFLRGKGQLVSIDYQPSPEQAGDEFPYVLITGRVLEHYNVGTMTFRTPNSQIVSTDVLELNPDDAAAHGIEDDARVTVRSRWGAIDVAARSSLRIAPGTMFLSFHDAATHTNRLVGPHVDPLSKCPGYKVTAVNLALSKG